jgi:hypothetical protein
MTSSARDFATTVLNATLGYILPFLAKIWGFCELYYDNDGVCYLTDQHVELDLYSACSLKQQSAGIYYHGLS